MAAQKIIIDTDPGIDDAMAIHQAFADTRLEVIGLTTIFGNVYVNQATRNALWLAEQGAYKCSVSEGAAKPIIQKMNTPMLLQYFTGIRLRSFCLHMEPTILSLMI